MFIIVIIIKIYLPDYSLFDPWVMDHLIYNSGSRGSGRQGRTQNSLVAPLINKLSWASKPLTSLCGFGATERGSNTFKGGPGRMVAKYAALALR